MEIGEETGPRVKLLIVKFSSIGDCVMAVPAASMFRRAFPSGFLSWAVDPRCADVIDDGLVNQKFLIPWEQWKREKVSGMSRAKHYLQLRKEKFDVGIDLQGHGKTAICLRLSGARKRATVEPWDVAARILNPVAKIAPGLHTVERNLAVFRQMGIDHADTSPIMPSTFASAPEGLISIAVSTGHPKKNLPLEMWAEVAAGLRDMGHPVAFVGGPTDTAPAVDGVTDYCAKLSLKETMGILAASRLHIAGDTGSGHICAAYGIPVISIFGATDPAIFRPYGPLITVLKADEKMHGVTAVNILASAKAALA